MTENKCGQRSKNKCCWQIDELLQTRAVIFIQSSKRHCQFASRAVKHSLKMSKMTNVQYVVIVSLQFRHSISGWKWKHYRCINTRHFCFHGGLENNFTAVIEGYLRLYSVFTLQYLIHFQRVDRMQLTKAFIEITFTQQIHLRSAFCILTHACF